MSGECDKCGDHALEWEFPIILEKKWISKQEAKELFPLSNEGIDPPPEQPKEEPVKNFDPFEEHVCRGGLTETWLVPGGTEFWLIFKTKPERFTWIKYCPYCGYHPTNLRHDWENDRNRKLD